MATTVGGVFPSSKAGRLSVATREDELAAGAMGIKVFTPRLAAFVVSGGVVALGGILRVQSLGSIGPSQFSFEFTILILAMLVVGGMRTITGRSSAPCSSRSARRSPVSSATARTSSASTGPSSTACPISSSPARCWRCCSRGNGLLGEFDLGRPVARWWRDPPPPLQVGAEHRPAVAPSTAWLRTDGLGVKFGGFVAVDDVSIRVEPGRIHGLIGPNGAGKTTFVNLLTGVVDATSGTVYLGEVEIQGKPHTRARAGIGRTFQNLRVFASLSVRENVDVADLVAHDHRSTARASASTS